MPDRPGLPNLAEDFARLEERVRYLEAHRHKALGRGDVEEIAGGLAQPVASVSIGRSTDQSIPDDTVHEVDFNTIVHDLPGGSGPVSPDLANNRIVINAPVLVTVIIQGAFRPESDSNGRAIYLKWNNQEYHAFDSDTAENQSGFVMGLNAATHRAYDEGDYVTMEALQRSGGPLDLRATDYSPILSVLVRGLL